jgi:hypothetical protein
VQAEAVVLEVQVADIEEAILQAKVQRRSNRLANSGDALPGPRTVAVVEAEVRKFVDVLVVADIGPAGASADIAGPAGFLVLEIDQGIGHYAEHRNVTVGVEERPDDRSRQCFVDLRVPQAGALVTDLAFEPDRAEIVAGNRIDIEANLVLDLEPVGDGDSAVVVVIAIVFDDHKTAFDADIQ